MARAKSTDRAEARRRHRAILMEQAAARAAAAEAEAQGVDASAPSGPSSERRRATSKPASATPAARTAGGQPSVFAALRSSIRPVNLREDLRALPDMTLHTRAIWLPTVLMLVGVAGAIVTGDGLIRAVVVAILYPTPVLPAFLAGILAPKASYLAGGIVGVLGGLFIFAYALLTSAVPTGNGGTVSQPTTDEALALLSYVVFSGLFFGLLFGAFASFYRRFLSMSTAARNQRQRAQKSSRPAPRGR